MENTCTMGFYSNYREGQLDPEVETFLSSLRAEDAGPALPLSALSPEALRGANGTLQWSGPMDPRANKADIGIPGPDGKIAARVYRPREGKDLPVLLYFHGGGFVFGSLDEADHLCAAFDDALASLAWPGAGIASHGGDCSRIAMAGESAGDNLAAALCQAIRDGRSPAISFQLLLCPWLDLSNFARPSHIEFGQGPWLSLASLECYRDHYLDGDRQSWILRSPPFSHTTCRDCQPPTSSRLSSTPCATTDRNTQGASKPRGSVSQDPFTGEWCIRSSCSMASCHEPTRR